MEEKSQTVGAYNEMRAAAAVADVALGVGASVYGLVVHC